MTRTLRTILIFGIVGAVLNVAVAWGCAKAKTPVLTKRPLHVTAWTGPPVDWAGEERFFLAEWTTGFGRSTTVVRADSRRLPSAKGPGGAEWIHQTRSYGFPAISLEYELVWRVFWGYFTGPFGEDLGVWRNGLGDRRFSDRLPIMPTWPGFATNTACYGVLAWFTMLAVTSTRQQHRRRRGLCPYCGYDMTGLDTCSECGR